jgi:hypothetical protein
MLQRIMSRYAILAVFTLIWPLSAISVAHSEGHAIDEVQSVEGDQDAPAGVKVQFKLRDGITISGVMTAWDESGIDGTFGRRLWRDIRPRDIVRLHRHFIDRDDADDWIALGRRLLLVGLDDPKSTTFAEQMFATALAKDTTCADRIDAARTLVEDERARRAAIAAKAEAERLRTMTPEAHPWPADPWPKLNPSERDSADKIMRADAAAMLKKAGMTLAPVESRYFLLYTDLSRREAATWIKELDLMYGRLAAQFLVEPGENVFWGKAVVFVFTERDRFQLVEAESFQHLPPEWESGVCHPVGPKVFLCLHRTPDTPTFSRTLAPHRHARLHAPARDAQTPPRLGE